MTFDENDFRRRYAELSDEGLLSINREELVNLARQCYDEELARRGLQYEDEIGEEPAGIGEPFVAAATFLFPDEAEVARGLLRSADILCYLENEHTLAKVWQWNVALGGLRLMVPTSLLYQVHEILNELISAEDFTAQAGMEAELDVREYSFRIFAHGRSGGRARTMLAIAVLCAPALETFRLLYVGR
jgi:hypothetical protein